MAESRAVVKHPPIRSGEAVALPSKAKFVLHCEYEGRSTLKKDCVAGPEDQTLVCGDVRSCREPSISTMRAT